MAQNYDESKNMLESYKPFDRNRAAASTFLGQQYPIHVSPMEVLAYWRNESYAMPKSNPTSRKQDKRFGERLDPSQKQRILKIYKSMPENWGINNLADLARAVNLPIRTVKRVLREARAQKDLEDRAE